MDLDLLKQTEFDAAVIGAGPAGSTAAYLLAKKGFSVLLVDKEKFPRRKVCGACLNARALNLLNQIGLAQAVQHENPVPLSGFHFAYRGKEVKLPLGGGVSLSRECFDSVLVREAQKAGAVFLDGAHAEVGKRKIRNQVEFCIKIQPGSLFDFKARIVIAADGLGGSSLRNLNEFQSVPAPQSRFGAGLTVHQVPAFYKPGVIYMAAEKNGYAGAVLLEDGRLNIAAALDASILKNGQNPTPARAVADLFSRAGFAAIPDMEQAEVRGTPALTRRRGRVASDRIFVIGDSAGYVEPFTGEGMEWALQTAQAAADLAAEGIKEWKSFLVERWNHTYDALIRRRQFYCRLISLGLRNEIIMNLAVFSLTRKPGLASGLVSWIHGVNA